MNIHDKKWNSPNENYFQVVFLLFFVELSGERMTMEL